MTTEKRTFVLSGVNIHTDRTETYTTAMVELSDGFTVIGTAKRNPDDEPNRDMGATIAVARMLREVADYYERGADVIEWRDDVHVAPTPGAVEAERAASRKATRRALKKAAHQFQTAAKTVGHVFPVSSSLFDPARMNIVASNWNGRSVLREPWLFEAIRKSTGQTEDEFVEAINAAVERYSSPLGSVDHLSQEGMKLTDAMDGRGMEPDTVVVDETFDFTPETPRGLWGKMAAARRKNRDA